MIQSRFPFSSHTSFHEAHTGVWAVAKSKPSPFSGFSNKSGAIWSHRADYGSREILQRCRAAVVVPKLYTHVWLAQSMARGNAAPGHIYALAYPTSWHFTAGIKGLGPLPLTGLKSKQPKELLSDMPSMAPGLPVLGGLTGSAAPVAAPLLFFQHFVPLEQGWVSGLRGNTPCCNVGMGG